LRKEKEKKKKGKKRAPAKIRGAFGEGTAEVAKEKGALHVAQQNTLIRGGVVLKVRCM
jgi:hypothetical protein